jgi:hypothetical protein
MATNYLKTTVHPSPKILCLSKIPHTIDNVQYNVGIIKKATTVLSSVVLCHYKLQLYTRPDLDMRRP